MPLSKLICKAKTAVQTKRERRKDARPGELLASAMQLFVEKGFAATTVEEVARRAGVSKGTLFLYFASKEELFKAVVRENISAHYPEWNAKLDTFEGSTADMVRQFMQLFWVHVGTTNASGICKLMMSEASNFPELALFYQEEVIEPGSELVRRILQRGMDRGEFRTIDLKYGVYTVLAPMLFLVLWKHSLGTCCPANAQLLPEEYIAVQVETILNGLCLPKTASTEKNISS